MAARASSKASGGGCGLRRWGGGASLAIALVVVGCRATAPAPPPDVFLIVVDTLRADHVSLYGYARATTPHLDAFARDAVVYERAISPGTWTVPAHAALFTGRWPSYAGAERVPGDRILATPIDGRAPVLAELLGTHGFRTAAFVANTTYVARVLGFARGFGEFFDWKVGLADGVRNAVREWVDARSERVFVFVNILDPHEPYEPPKPYDRRFPGRDEQYGTLMTTLVKAGAEVTPAMRAHFVSQYDGEIAYTDQALGAMFADLKRTGRYDRSLVIVTSDHGELLGEHGLAGHGLAPYEELVHVPLLVKYPGNSGAGTRVARRVSTLGVFATILATAGVPPPPGTHARALEEEHPVWVEDIDPLGRRVRVGYEGELKLVETAAAGGSVTDLYDLDADPTESHPTRETAGAAVLRASLDVFERDVRPVNDATPPVIEPERARQLRALGYIQ